MAEDQPPLSTLLLQCLPRPTHSPARLRIDLAEPQDRVPRPPVLLDHSPLLSGQHVLLHGPLSLAHGKALLLPATASPRSPSYPTIL